MLMLETLVDTLHDEMSSVFARMDIAEQEIEKSQARHRETGRGKLWGSFHLLKAPLENEIIYRVHCREILDRVAAGTDTRPATDAEMINALRAASRVSPLSSAAACLYFRITARSFPGLWAKAGDNTDLRSYEAVHGSKADEHEDWLRAKLTVADRQ